MAARLLDELALPIRKLALHEAEIVALTALIVLDAGSATFDVGNLKLQKWLPVSLFTPEAARDTSLHHRNLKTFNVDGLGLGRSLTDQLAAVIRELEISDSQKDILVVEFCVLLKNDIEISRARKDYYLIMHTIILNKRYVLKKAILQISDAPGLSPETSQSLSSLRNRVQHALFQMIRERIPSEQPTSAAASRFGNILLLLPPLAVLFRHKVNVVDGFDVAGGLSAPFHKADSPTSPLSPQPIVSLPTVVSAAGSGPHRVTPLIVQTHNTNNSYNVYFPYSEQFPGTSTTYGSSQSAGPYVSQSNFFESGPLPAAADIFS
uniref:NR LBD domain-containing protein n=1 Tax=Parascaris equorum TaxID=6256 RepID=A0A914R9I1_PAREQ